MQRGELTSEGTAAFPAGLDSDEESSDLRKKNGTTSSPAEAGSRRFRPLRKPLSNGVLLVIFLILGFILFLPYLHTGFFFDDFFWISILEEKNPYSPLVGFWGANPSPWNIFDFLWWTDSRTAARFFRPLFSFVFATAWKILGRDAALPLHVLSLALHCMISFTVYLIFFKLSRKFVVSMAAGLIFLICEDHIFTVAWISAATDLIAAIFMCLGIYFHLDFRETDKRSALLLSNICILAAFFGKESAVMGPAAIMLYELVFSENRNERETLRGKLEGFLGAWRYWGPSFTIGVAFVVSYRLLGFGTNNLLYHNPLSQPALYFSTLLISIPVALAGLLSVFPIDLTLLTAALTAPAAVVGIVLFVLFSVALIPYRHLRIVQFCFGMMVVSLLPAVSMGAVQRSLYVSHIPASYLAAFLILQLPGLKRRFFPDTPERMKYLGTAIGCWFILSCVLLALVSDISTAGWAGRSVSDPEKRAFQVRSLADGRNARHIVWLNAPNLFAGFYAAEVFRYHFGRDPSVHVLSAFPGTVWVKQLSDDSFVLKTDKKGWLTNFFARVARVTPEIEQGMRFTNKLFTVTVLEVSPDRKDVLEARFDFSSSICDKSLLFVYYDGRDLRDWRFAKGRTNGKWELLGDSSDFMKDLM